MASSNRHWPSMFRSKHATQPWQTQPDMAGSPPSLLSGSSAGSAGGGGGGGYSGLKSSPFSSGLAASEYGQVGDANVFYWFQNRKSRSKNKLRSGTGRAALGLGSNRPCATAPREAVAPSFTPPPILPPQPVQQQQQQLVSPVAAPTSSSSSSSDRSSGSSKPVRATSSQAMSVTAAMDLLSPLAAACEQQMLYQGQPLESPSAPAPAPAPRVHGIVAPDEPIFLQWPQSPCLSAVDLGAAILGGQYMHLPVPAAQPPSSPGAGGMFWGLCNDVSAPNNTGHKSCAWSAGLGQHWCGSADQLGLGKSSAASIAAGLSRPEEAHDVDATKLGLLQYGFGITTPTVHVDVTSSAAGVLPPVPSSLSPPDATVTVASVAATASLTDFAASAISTGAVANNQLQGLADFGLVAGGSGAGVVCVGVAGAAPPLFYPAAHFNVRHYFGDEAELLRYRGDSRTEPVPVDESGVTVEPLQQGAVYIVLM
uniref:Homeobox domain-containing protein n=1 Tax=Oryza punctata TaxID=4537 RepID=A0A0E0JM59_ORYPU